MVAEILIYVNIILGLTIAMTQMLVYRKLNGVAWKWIKLVLGLIGVYWAGVYVAVAILSPGDFLDPVKFGQIFVRPAITVTLAVIAAASVIGWKYKRRGNG